RRSADRNRWHAGGQRIRPRLCVGGESISPRAAAERHLLHQLSTVHHRNERRDRRQRGGHSAVRARDVVFGARGVAARSDRRDPGRSMKRIACAAFAAAFFLSCDPLIRRVVVLTFNEAADVVAISATTTLGTAT